jgi:hypothetical protein
MAHLSPAATAVIKAASEASDLDFVDSDPAVFRESAICCEEMAVANMTTPRHG